MVILAGICYNANMIEMEQRISHLDAIMAELAHAQVRGEIELKQIRWQAQQQAQQMAKLDTRFHERLTQYASAPSITA
jgi:hypothetical protein